MSKHQEFFYHLSLLHDRIQQVQSLIHLVLLHQAPTQHQGSIASKIGSIMQEFIFTATSMMTICHTLSPSNPSMKLPSTTSPQPVLGNNAHSILRPSIDHGGGSPATLGGEDHDWVLMEEDGTATDSHLDANYYINGLSLDMFNDLMPQAVNHIGVLTNLRPSQTGLTHPDPSSCTEIIELSPDELLAEFTHHCHICGKGFKRGANLRMHMRAHGDEYKTNAALVRPKGHGNDALDPKGHGIARKYSCPQEGCRWNKRHDKFQPLKSMICVKNHYKRNHCPKVYVCKRCNGKNFSVLADLRTHEKHCGDLKWQCSCGTCFSRKDKLLGHVALFKGHTPFVRCSSSNLAKKG